MEQFRRLFNVFWLMQCVIVLIPGLSPYSSFTTISGFVFVLGVAGLKDAYEDYQRFAPVAAPPLSLTALLFYFEKEKTLDPQSKSPSVIDILLFGVQVQGRQTCERDDRAGSSGWEIRPGGVVDASGWGCGQDPQRGGVSCRLGGGFVLGGCRNAVRRDVELGWRKDSQAPVRAGRAPPSPLPL
eukprot:1113971-Rhodomonas_salina.3